MTAARERLARAPLLEAGFTKLRHRLLAPVARAPRLEQAPGRLPLLADPARIEVTATGSPGWSRPRPGWRPNSGSGSSASGTTATWPGSRWLPEDVGRLSTAGILRAIVFKMKELGFLDGTIDPRGYRRADPMPGEAQEVL